MLELFDVGAGGEGTSAESAVVAIDKSKDNIGVKACRRLEGHREFAA